MSYKSFSPMASCLLVATLACGGSDTNNNHSSNNNSTNNNTTNNNSNNNNNNSGLTCPQATSLTVCDLKLDGGSQQPQLGDPVVLEEVVVTTAPYAILRDDMGMATLSGFFVQDTTTTAELDGRFSGIQVTYRPNDIQGQLPAVGDVIRIEGSYRDFGQETGPRQKQLSATFLGTATAVSPATPKTIADPSTIASGGMMADDYEGVLVQLEGVSATVVTDVPGAGGSNIFGAFMVSGGLVVSGTLYQEPRVRMGEMFTRITGVLRLGTAPFDSGISLFTPRSADDVVRAEPLDVTTSLVALQDPSHPDHPTLCTSTGSMTVGDCPIVEFSNVVVTAVDSFVSTNLRALWIMDTTVADGRYAGVKVVYAASETTIPQVGNRINVSGEAVDFFDGRQLQFVDMEIVDSGTSSVAAHVVASTDIARGSGADNPYEGVLVRIEDVETTVVCVEASNGRDFGNFLVTGDVFIGNAFNYDYNGSLVSSTMCDMPNVDCSCAGMSRPGDMRVLGEQFSSITGVMNYSFNDLRLEPRSDADIAIQ